jgi:hypothetical protein
MANASDTSKTSFAEKDGNESTESTQIPLKDMKSFKKNNSTTSQTPSDTSQMANASDTSKTSFAEGWEREYRVYSNSTQKDEEF